MKSAACLLAAVFSLATISCSASEPDQAGSAAAPEQAAAAAPAPDAAPAADVAPAAAAETAADTAPAADAAPAAAAAPAAGPQPSVARESLEQVSATVDSIDQASRLITLKGEGGQVVSFEAGPEVKNFAQIREGDKVVISYYRGIAAELQPKGTPLSKKVDQMDVTTGTEAGTKPYAGAGTAVHATVVIEKVDSINNTVTFKRPDGISRTLQVKSPEGQNFIAKLKKGDQVEVLYTEAVAVEVRPQ